MRMSERFVHPRSDSLIWRLYEGLAMVLGLGALALLCVVWLPFAALLLLLPARIGRPAARRVHSLAFRCYLAFLSAVCACQFDLAALDELQSQGPLVVVANHPSLLDAVMIISRMPNAVCIMKAALLGNPLFGLASRVAGYIPNVGPLEMVLHAREALEHGAQLLIFPEGSRTRNFPVDACSASAGVIAKASGMPVQAVLIECSTPYLGKRWPLWRPPQLPLSFRVVLGRRFGPFDSSHPSEDAGTLTHEMETYFRSELQGRPPSTAGGLS